MTIPQWAQEKINEAKTQKLVFLDLSHHWGEKTKPLTYMPEDILEMPYLTTLFLSGNQLATLPSNLGRLKRLTTLFLNDNSFLNLPSSISQLQNLVMLDIAGNQLSTFPKSIIALSNLATLFLDRNQIGSLPDHIATLEKLSVLVINDNKIANLPETFVEMTSLTKINLGGNRLASLPESLIKLQNLEELNLSNNHLTQLPVAIAKLQKLTLLDVSGNQLESPPQEVAVKGVNFIRQYFRQLGEEGQDHLYEAKLLIIGEGGAGKTTLIKKIENPGYQLRDEKSTDGIHVLNWSFPIKGNKLFRVNIWDFGGQEIYHATHQFFLTKRSLYVLVVDTRRDDTDFYYWLNVVELLSDNSPLLIVKNEKQDRHREINERLLRGEFDNLKTVLSCNLADNRGLANIKKEIMHYVWNLPHIGSPLPKTWVRVREILEKDNRNYISFDEFLGICKDNGFLKLKDSILLSGYLHDLGVCLHFQDDWLLRKIIILKPHWGTDAVYKVLDNPTVIRNLGRFSHSDLLGIWNSSDDANMHDELIQLMMKFKLCYQIPNSTDTYIAPQLLTENQPNLLKRPDKGSLILRYVYEFMPKGLISQFIVAIHPFIAIHDGESLMWKSGVVIRKDQTDADVVEYYGKREIRVEVVGAHKKELLTIVMHELDKIHSTYKRLRYDKLVPCNCEVCKGKKEPYFYKWDALQKFVEDKQDRIQCQQSYKMISVRGLMDDIVGWQYDKDADDRMVMKRQYMSRGVVIGDNFSGNVIVGSNVENSFNELQSTLNELSQAVEEMKEQLPKDKAEEVAEDMEMLVEQASKDKPNPKWYSVSIDGLIKSCR